MIAKTWIALALGAAFMVGGIATVSAVGSMNGNVYGDPLQDGSCGDCPDGDCQDLADDEVVEDDTCDSCLDWDYNFLYGEDPEAEPPHQSACGQE
jgi:hypothetical protein